MEPRPVPRVARPWVRRCLQLRGQCFSIGQLGVYVIRLDKIL
jgi:hypothetical protein